MQVCYHAPLTPSAQKLLLVGRVVSVRVILIMPSYRTWESTGAYVENPEGSTDLRCTAGA